MRRGQVYKRRSGRELDVTAVELAGFSLMDRQSVWPIVFVSDEDHDVAGGEKWTPVFTGRRSDRCASTTPLDESYRGAHDGRSFYASHLPGDAATWGEDEARGRRFRRLR